MERVAGVILAAAVLAAACTTTRPLRPGMRVEVFPPVDRVPVRDQQVWVREVEAVAEARHEALVHMQVALAAALEAKGVEVCLADVEGGQAALEAEPLAGRAQGDRVDAVVVPELVAYGQIPRSWLWLLFGQGLVAGIGHGVAAAKVTGNPSTGWIVGSGEFLLETVTWVGGALVASRVADPVIVRLWVVPAQGGPPVRRTGEGLRPPHRWFRKDEPRPQRLLRVARDVLARLAAKLVAGKPIPGASQPKASSLP